VVDPSGFTNPPTIIPNPPVKSATAKSEQKVNHNLLEKVVTHDVDLTPVKPVEPILPGSEAGTGKDVPSGGVDSGNKGVEVPTIIDPPKILVFAEVMPEYEGGISAMLKFLSKNLRYPPSARNMGIEGSVFVRFVVNDRGHVVDVEVVKGVNAALDTEAARVVALMKKWKPGKQHDIPVNVRMVLPIKFELARE